MSARILIALLVVAAVAAGVFGIAQYSAGGPGTAACGGAGQVCSCKDCACGACGDCQCAACACGACGGCDCT